MCNPRFSENAHKLHTNFPRNPLSSPNQQPCIKSRQRESPATPLLEITVKSPRNPACHSPKISGISPPSYCVTSANPSHHHIRKVPITVKVTGTCLLRIFYPTKSDKRRDFKDCEILKYWSYLLVMKILRMSVTQKSPFWLF